ncbi:MAG TPA: OmpA family protein [Vicinamibacteria bacterium]|nr:OmpA family protein [Vicinamibacteria bacterium]
MTAAPLRAGPWVLLVVGLALDGCAARQKSVVVLLPQEGSSAEVTVTNRRGTEVLSQPYQSTEVASPDKKPRVPVTLDDAQVQRLFGQALAAMPSPPVRFLLHFESDSTELTEESRDLLPQILDTIAQRSPAEVAVIGHTDTMGAPDRNHGLGMERAVAVADLLKSLGVEPASLDTSSHGDSDLLVPTADEVDEPQNRRVEVTVR